MEKPNIEFCMLNIGNYSNKAKEILATDPMSISPHMDV